MAKKTSCPISRAEFAASAKPVAVQVGAKSYTAMPKEFSTGSLGWNINDKITIDIAGKQVTVQVGMNLTIIGSKELPKAPVSNGGAQAPIEGVPLPERPAESGRNTLADEPWQLELEE